MIDSIVPTLSTSFAGPDHPMTNHPTDAKFWPRAYATLVDGIILGICNISMAALILLILTNFGVSWEKMWLFSQNYFGGSMTGNMITVILGSTLILSILTQIIYNTYYLSSPDQATPGMKLHCLKLVDAQENRVTFGRLILRELISILSFWGFFIGYLMIGLTKRHQALHDLLTSTYVKDISDHQNPETFLSERYKNYSYAGFWKRFGANFSDSMIWGIIFKGYDFLTQSIIDNETGYIIIISIILLMMYYFYNILFISSKFQATPGKMMFSLKVTDIYGNRLTFFKAFIRFHSFIFSYFFYIGFLMVAFTKRNQGLHDKIARTLVIHVPRHLR